MKLFLTLIAFCFIAGCAPKKPALTQNQIIDGKSIILPPEYTILPK